MTSEVVAQLRQWEGRSETVHERIAAAPARALAATLNLEDAPRAEGDVLPALWHWMHFLQLAPQATIGPDGHPRRGGFLPLVPLPRRMWAGGRLQWHAPLCIGAQLQRTSTIASVQHKVGRSGHLVFVVVRHEIGDGQRNLLTEEDIVYRAPARPGDAAPARQEAPQGGLWSREITPDPVFLFRYSALSFNGHRIHYDRDYATREEGYQGLVVHGPLLATLLVHLLRRELPGARLTGFNFKAVAPTLDLHPFKVCGRPSADGRTALLWAQDHTGGLNMQAEARFDV